MKNKVFFVKLEEPLGHIVLTEGTDKTGKGLRVTVEYRDTKIVFKSWDSARAASVAISMFAQNIYDAQTMKAHLDVCKAAIIQNKIHTTITGYVEFSDLCHV